MSLEVVETPEGRQVLRDGRKLYSSPPVESAVRRIKTLSLLEGTIVLWESPLLWHGTDALASRLPPNCIVLPIEVDQELFSLSARLEHHKHEAVRPLTPGTITSVLDAYRACGQSRFRRVVEITTSGAARGNRDHYSRIAAAIAADLERFWRNRMTLARLGGLWLRNMIANVPSLMRASKAESVHTSAIVCGAGPTLDSSIDWIRAHRSNLATVAVDTALMPLREHGIDPDLVVSLDAQVANALDFVGPKPRALAADLTTSPSILTRASTVLLTLSRFVPATLMDRMHSAFLWLMPIPALGSVGVSAVHLARHLTKQPVILAGLDFAFLPGRTHAKGSPHSRISLSKSTRVSPSVDPALGRPQARLKNASAEWRTTAVLREYAGLLMEEVGADSATVVAASPLTDSFSVANPTERGGQSAGFVWERVDRSVTVREVAAFIEGEIDVLSNFNVDEDDSLSRADYLAALVPDAIQTMTDELILDKELIRSNLLVRRRLQAAAGRALTLWKSALVTVRSTTRHS